MAPAQRVYLDYNATAPLRPAAQAAMQAAMDCALGNPASPHREGRSAYGLLDTARQQVAALAGAGPGEVVFTSGGTEAVNAMIVGVALAADAACPRRIVATATDHPCVLDTVAGLSPQGWEVPLVPVDAAGRLDLGALRDALRGGAACVVTHWANNETGVLQDLDAVAAVCAEHAVPLLVDAVQAVGKLPVDFRSCPAHALALSAHKIGGPQGVGALVLDAQLPCARFHRGGHQEHDRRGGTEPVLAAVGFGSAAAEAAGEAVDYAARVAPRRDALLACLREAVPTLVVHGAAAPRVANTLNVRVPGWAGDTVVQRLDLEGIAVGTGAACAAGAAEPSHVMRAMGLAPAAAAEAVRFSLGYATSADEIAAVAAVLARLAVEWGTA